MSRDFALGAGLLAVLTLAGWGLASGAGSADLQALWYAAEFLARGETQHVYVGSEGVFTMQPPEAWVALDRARGGDDALYPYIYPPLWAALAAPLTGWMSFQTFAAGATVLNAALLAAIPALIWRIARPGLGFLPFVILGYAALVFSTAGSIAQFENQPQILVSFLIVAAIERARAESPVLAGAALALAAAIKLYPALFALFWLVSGRRSPVLAFALIGGALGLVSIALAGWPLHTAFLHELSAISDTVVHTMHNYNLSPVVASFAMPGSFEFVESLRSGGGTGWNVAPAPAAWGWAMRALLLIAIGALLWLMAKSDHEVRGRAVWPLVIGGIAFLSPLTWSYHYIPLIAWAPALLGLWGTRRGLTLLVICLMPVIAFVVIGLAQLGVSTRVVLALGSAAILGLLAAFAIPALQALRPEAGTSAETARPGLAPR